MKVTIFHNPGCSKSRATLALLQSRGIEPRIVEYLKTPPDVATLKQLLAALDLDLDAIVRSGDSAYADSPLAGSSGSAKLEALSANPKFLQRPIVTVGDRARIGRPPEAVLEILDARP